MSNRKNRVADLLRAEISAILLRDIKDPRVNLASVTSVDVSGDLGFAKVMISVLGNREAREDCIAALERAAGFIRSSLARKVHLRKVPHLTFILDRGAEHSQEIFELLESLHDDDSQSS